jgi:hypothetical protein
MCLERNTSVTGPFFQSGGLEAVAEAEVVESAARE